MKPSKIEHDRVLPVTFLGGPPTSRNRRENNRYKVFELHTLDQKQFKNMIILGSILKAGIIKLYIHLPSTLSCMPRQQYYPGRERTVEGSLENMHLLKIQIDNKRIYAFWYIRKICISELATISAQIFLYIKKILIISCSGYQ